MQAASACYSRLPAQLLPARAALHGAEQWQVHSCSPPGLLVCPKSFFYRDEEEEEEEEEVE